jgi:hypothetical protein
VDTASFSIAPPDEGTVALRGVAYTFGELQVESSSILQRRARELSEEAQRVMKFYGTLLGDIPYPSFTLAIVERNQPGGHSPPYFATLNQPPPATPISWRADPAYFEGFPEFFVAHEAAHQWWGQAVGWKNYHEQWISEGFAQYFAALYAQHIQRDRVFDSVIGQMARWTLDRSASLMYLAIAWGAGTKGGCSARSSARVSLHYAADWDDAFFRARQFATWRFRKAGTEDVKAAFEAESNRDLDRFFDRWIYGSSLPRLKFSYTTEPDAVTVRFEQLGEIFDVPITVTLEYANSSTKVTIPVTEQVTTRRIPTSGALRSVEANGDKAAPVVFVR